jgi:tripartite-type tricarboxylate transporter receptor subunit TctC
MPPKGSFQVPGFATFLACLLAAGCGGGADARSTLGSEGSCPAVAGETVRWIVASGAGGSMDVVSRLLEPFYERAIGAEIAVEIRAGAGGAIGGRAIRDADPDGLTLGVVNGTARLVADLSEELQGLHPLRDFTVLGRVAVEDALWVTGSASPYRTIQDVLSAAERQPVLFGISDVGATSFVLTSVPAELLDLDVAYVSGYPGGQEYLVGVIRGELDVGGIAFESVRDRIEAGELRPILQISERPIAEHPSLEGVPLLGGPDGLAAQRARERGEDPEAALLHTDALNRLFQIGRLVVAPPGLPAEVSTCLSERLAGVMGDPEFLAAAATARRPISFADPATLSDQVQEVDDDLQLLSTILREHIARTRGRDSGR